MTVKVLTTTDALVSKWLCHLPVLRPDVLMVLHDPVLRGLSTYALLADPDDSICHGLHAYLRRVAAARVRGLVPTTPVRFGSRRELLEFGEAQRRSQCWSPAMYDHPFAPPTGDATVLPGEPQVELRPVLTAAQMHDVALQDRLCIASARRFPQEAISGSGAMFTAMWRDDGEDCRATVWLSCSSFRGWCVEEVRARYNKPAPEWLGERLEPWVEEINRACVAPVEPLTGPTPDPQPSLPLRWSASPLDASPPSEPRSSSERPSGLWYPDHWLVAG